MSGNGNSADRLVRAAVRGMNGYVPGEQPIGDGIIKLNTNENPYPASLRVFRILTDRTACRLNVYPDPTCAEIRSELGRQLNVGTDRILVCNGSDEALALCTRTFAEDNGEIGYLTPSYSLYPTLAEIRGCRRREVELGPDFEWPWPRDGAGIAGLGCSLFFIANPNAPTGIRYPAEHIGTFCDLFKGVVIADEAYADFADGNCMKLVDRHDNLIVTRSLSKSYSLAGIRVGYAVGRPELISAMFKVKDSYNVNALSQKLALAALRDVEHMKSNVEKVRATRSRLSAELASRGFRVYPSETNFVWARPPDGNAAGLYRNLKEKNIYIRYFPGRRTGEFVRITVGTDAEIDTLLESIPHIA